MSRLCSRLIRPRTKPRSGWLVSASLLSVMTLIVSGSRWFCCKCCLLAWRFSTASGNRKILYNVRKEFSMRTEIRIDGQELFTDDPKELLSLALSRSDLQYWSLESLKELFFGTLDQLKEFCDARRKETDRHQDALRKKLTSFVRRVKRMKQYFPDEQEAAVRYIYNQLLVCEGCGLLPGFGMASSIGDKLAGNPEVRSIYK